MWWLSKLQACRPYGQKTANCTEGIVTPSLNWQIYAHFIPLRKPPLNPGSYLILAPTGFAHNREKTEITLILLFL